MRHDDSGQVAVQAKNRRVTMHDLLDPGQCAPGTAFTDDHRTVCGQRRFGEAMPADTDVAGYRQCGACACATATRGQPLPHMAGRDHAADGAVRRGH